MIKQLLNSMIQEGFVKMFINGIRYSVERYMLRRDYCVRSIHGSMMRLSLKDDGISRVLAVVGTREKEHLYILEKVLKKGMNVLDIGANIGYYSLILSRLVGNEGKIFAFEPEPVNYGHLKHNIKLNLYDNIFVYNAGMSNVSGKTTMYLSKLSNVHTLLPDDVQNQMSGKTIEVNITTPSKFIKNGKKINCFRLDVEGFEIEILRDVYRLVKDGLSSPMLLFELHPAKYTEEHSLKREVKKLMDLGYRFKYMASSRKELFVDLSYEYEKKVYTDGMIRYIYKNVSNLGGLRLLHKCRTVLMVKD